MALSEEVRLEIQGALRQLDQLQQRLADLGAVVDVPVNIQGEEALTTLEQQIRDASAVVDVDVDTSGVAGAEGQIDSLNDELVRTEAELEDATREADRFGRELDTTGNRGVQAVGGIRSALGPLLAGAAAGIGFGALVRQFSEAIDSATALEESINAINVTFGEGATDVLAFGENAAQSVGLAASEFNELVTPIGALLQNFNLDGREAAEAATELTTRAADMASVFNTEVSDALGAVGAALRGETEPIRRFGVNINQAALDAKALELGLVGVGEEVSIAARGQAAYAEVLDQTARFAGDFERTSEGAANQQRILAAEVEEARASLGDALLPAFQDLLGVVPDLIGTLEDMAPALEAVASLSGVVVDNFAPVSQVFGEAAAGLSNLIGAADDLPGDVPFFDQIVDDLGLMQGAIPFALERFVDLRDVVTRGFTDTQLEQFLENVGVAAEDAADPMLVFEDAVAQFSDQAEDVVPFLEDLAEAAGLSDDELAQFIQGLILSADRMELTSQQVITLRDLLNELGGIDVTQAGGALIDFDFGDIPRNAAATTEAVEAADRALLNLVTGSDAAAEALEGTSEAFPTIIRDLGDLALAAEDAGVGVLEFVENLPDNVQLDLSAAEEEVLSLIGSLEEASTRLAEIDVSAAFGDVGEVDEETGQISDDIDTFLTDLETRAGELSELDFDLSQIQVVAPDLAQLLADSGLEASEIAAAFAADLDSAEAAQALLEGTEGLAAETASQYAGFLQTLTPQEVESLAVFGADNFVSPAIRGQLGETAEEVADILTESLSGQTIQPELIIDLSLVQFQNLPELIPEVTGANTAGQPSAGVTPQGGTTFNTEVNINNPTDTDITTSSTQAAQTIQAVSSSVGRVQ